MFPSRNRVALLNNMSSPPACHFCDQTILFFDTVIILFLLIGAEALIPGKIKARSVMNGPIFSKNYLISLELP